MEEFIKVNMKMTKNMEKDFFDGRMDGNMTEIGKMANKTVKAIII
jgi:hypothetical protein